MLIFASAIEKMGSMSLEQIGKGLLTMAGALTSIVVALQFMPPNMITIGMGMIGIATALLILSHALDAMGGMTWMEIAKGLVALGGSLLIIAKAMQFMQTALPGAAALLVISVALTVLAGVLKTLGSMSLAEIGKSLLALAGVFVIIGVAGALLTPLIPSLLGLARYYTDWCWCLSRRYWCCHFCCWSYCFGCCLYSIWSSNCSSCNKYYWVDSIYFNKT